MGGAQINVFKCICHILLLSPLAAIFSFFLLFYSFLQFPYYVLVFLALE